MDAEGSFMIKVRENKRLHLGWEVILVFSIGLHVKDELLLQQIKYYFKESGSLTKSKDMVKYSVSSLKVILNIIIPHFEAHSLLSQKKADYLLFKAVALMIKDKEHLTKKGLQKILDLKSSSNLGLSSSLKIAFPETMPVKRSNIIVPKIHPYWVSGFISGDGGFAISANPLQGKRVTLRMYATQHIRDILLMKAIKVFFGCGFITKDGVAAVTFFVAKFDDINTKVIPFFKEYPIQGVKALNYKDWVKAAEIVKEKKHITETGFADIMKIKAGMNRKRI